MSITEKFLVNFLFKIKSMYGCFWKRPDGFKEYYLKLDGYYYDLKKAMYIAIIRVKNKRTYEEVAINEIINDKEYLKELHPMDTFIIGLIANDERNGVIIEDSIGWRNMQRTRHYGCSIKSEPILYISKKYTDKEGHEIIVLKSKILNKEISIRAIELFKNQALLYSIGNYQAIEVGYDVSEIYLKHQFKSVE